MFINLKKKDALAAGKGVQLQSHSDTWRPTNNLKILTSVQFVYSAELWRFMQIFALALCQ